MVSIQQNFNTGINFKGAPCTSNKLCQQKLLKLAEEITCRPVGKTAVQPSVEHIKPAPQTKTIINNLKFGSTEVWQEIKLIVESLLNKISK